MANRLDLTKCHLSSVRRKAQSILDAVAGGTHPIKLGGQVIEEMLDTAISVPVGPFYRLLFTSQSLRPVAFLSHEQYNKQIRRPLKQ
jgi:hypothetical protein